MKKWERFKLVDQRVDKLRRIACKEYCTEGVEIEKYEDGSYILDCQTEQSKNVYYVHVDSKNKITGVGAIIYREAILKILQKFEQDITN